MGIRSDQLELGKRLFENSVLLSDDLKIYYVGRGIGCINIGQVGSVLLGVDRAFQQPIIYFQKEILCLQIMPGVNY